MKLYYDTRNFGLLNKIHMTIEDVSEKDILRLRSIAEKAVYESVDAPAQSKPEILVDIYANLDTWHRPDASAVFRKFVTHEKAVGFILIQEYWNLSDLFVLPAHHGSGIGLSLWESALQVCKEKSTRNKIRVNSSLNAVVFYKSLGFEEIVLKKEIPTWVVPLEFVF